ncbi:MAG: hypothetical protein IJU26_01075 [Synergistaceae bacterium]|nr:hypothetical protein [Synergistaceae bacterium]
MKKLKRRTAETLIEIITAMTVFGVISYGIFDFMANQTLHLARIRDRENMLYAAQKLISCSSCDVNVDKFTLIPDTGVEYTYIKTSKVLTLRNSSGTTMTFTIH